MYQDAVVDYATVMTQSNDANVTVLTEPLNLTQLAHYKTTVLREETHSYSEGPYIWENQITRSRVPILVLPDVV